MAPRKFEGLAGFKRKLLLAISFEKEEVRWFCKRNKFIAPESGLNERGPCKNRGRNRYIFITIDYVPHR